MTRAIAAFLGILILGVSSIFQGFGSETDIIHFNESNETLINPARGFFVLCYADEAENLSYLRQEGVTLVLLEYDIKDFITSKLSNEKLQELHNALEIAKDNALKVIFRAAYGFDTAYGYKDPKDISIVKTHIGQIAPIINEFSEIILCVQAGFLGPWGEWHSSNLLPENNEQRCIQNRNLVLSTWIVSLKEDMIINVRRPRFIRDAIAAGMNLSSFGLHNDALLADKSDKGTYDDPDYSRDEELQWMDKNLNLSMNGGEVSRISNYTKPAIADQSFQQMNISYINIDYNKNVLMDWKKQVLNGNNAYNEISKRLGYRLYLDKVELETTFVSGENLYYRIKINNSGYAAIPKEYTAMLVVSDAEQKYYYSLKSWNLHKIAGGESKTNIGTIVLPKDLSGDKVRIGIAITSNAVDNDIEYKDYVILANENISYQEGINYFAAYSVNQGVYQLDKQSLDTESDTERDSKFTSMDDNKEILENAQNVLIINGEIVQVGDQGNGWKYKDNNLLQLTGGNSIHSIIVTDSLKNVNSMIGDRNFKIEITGKNTITSSTELNKAIEIQYQGENHDESGTFISTGMLVPKDVGITIMGNLSLTGTGVLKLVNSDTDSISCFVKAYGDITINGPAITSNMNNIKGYHHVMAAHGFSFTENIQLGFINLIDGSLTIENVGSEYSSIFGLEGLKIDPNSIIKAGASKKTAVKVTLDQFWNHEDWGLKVGPSSKDYKYIYMIAKHITAPGKTKISRISNTGAGKATVYLESIKEFSGYQLAYSTNSKFTASTTKKITTNNTSKTLVNLTKGKTYYIKARAYRVKLNGDYVYGAYSTIKTITVKK
ncbi:MAG: DUF4832 domain-containing protein [Herbinix sp.]|nr:DUF4832 domain-containing protein [Herbinix sp.]